jgi:hypothetical protein
MADAACDLSAASCTLSRLDSLLDHSNVEENDREVTRAGASCARPAAASARIY